MAVESAFSFLFGRFIEGIGLVYGVNMNVFSSAEAPSQLNMPKWYLKIKP